MVVDSRFIFDDARKAFLRQAWDDAFRGLRRADAQHALAAEDLITGLVYCSAIATCRQVSAFDRAREWTATSRDGRANRAACRRSGRFHAILLLDRRDRGRGHERKERANRLGLGRGLRDAA